MVIIPFSFAKLGYDKLFKNDDDRKFYFSIKDIIPPEYRFGHV